ncbi:DUF1842 domain-containing protein [Aquimarina spongiae]|uniref:DUF1842 domain-containing protein n=1 Tax=Aquimarina spongiae TaxID=570521 RepID=A0A1M6KU47_9FLAO|nr:DUF1842 domain-containing protein [Aquimarina spongiae]SHJ62485.1 protein of unknown function [Aquimarina spongiae]
MSTAQLESNSAIAEAYLAKGTIGNVGMPGAPIAHFSLVVVPSKNTVSGSVEITQAIENGNTGIFSVKGNIRSTGYGKVTKIVNLEGEYIYSFPPPAIGSILQRFTAYMDIDDSWNGQGGFSYGGGKINNVPVYSEH